VTTRSADTSGSPPPQDERCPGGAQCPCSDGCDAAYTCGPHNACTKSCKTNADCDSGLDGEICVSNLCGVVCEPGASPSGGCVETGVGPNATCGNFNGSNICRYE
jgi:hypothetical protein